MCPHPPHERPHDNVQLRSIYIYLACIIQQRSFAKKRSNFSGVGIRFGRVGKSKNLGHRREGVLLDSIFSIVDSLLLVDLCVRRDDLLRAQKYCFLPLGSAAHAADEQHGQDPDHAEKNTNSASCHHQMSLGLTIESTPRRKYRSNLEQTPQCAPPKVRAISAHDERGARTAPHDHP